MAVTFDAVGPSSAGAASASSATLSWSHTVGINGAALIVAVAINESNDAGDSITGVVLDPAGSNIPLTSLGPALHSGGITAGLIHLWGLANAPAGTYTITATASAAMFGLEGGSVSYGGAHLTDPFSALQTAVGSADTTPGITFTGSTAGNLVYGGLANGDAVTSLLQGDSRWIRNVNTGSAAGNAAAADTPGGGSVTLEWSVASDTYGIAAIEVLAAAAPPSILVQLIHQI